MQSEQIKNRGEGDHQSFLTIPDPLRFKDNPKRMKKTAGVLKTSEPRPAIDVTVYLKI
jgi:hypothetical protein